LSLKYTIFEIFTFEKYCDVGNHSAERIETIQVVACSKTRDVTEACSGQYR